MWKFVVWGRPWMKWLPEWGRPWKEGNERLPPPKSSGGREHWLRSKDGLAGTLSTEAGLRDTAKGVECNIGGGGKGRRSGV